MSETPPMIKLVRRYVVEEPDRHGNLRHYFRVGHGPRTRIREKPGTEEFDRRYHELMRQHAAGELKLLPRDAAMPNTLRWLGVTYVQSAEFGQLNVHTQHVTNLILDSIYAKPAQGGVRGLPTREVRGQSRWHYPRPEEGHTRSRE